MLRLTVNELLLFEYYLLKIYVKTHRASDEAVNSWVEKLTNLFERQFTHKYRLLVKKHMVGIFTVIFVKEVSEISYLCVCVCR